MQKITKIKLTANKTPSSISGISFITFLIVSMIVYLLVITLSGNKTSAKNSWLVDETKKENDE